MESIILSNKIDKTRAKLSSKRNAKKSFEIFPEILSHLNKDSKFSVDEIKRLEELFGERVKKALELIAANKVKKYVFEPSNIIRWVIEGFEKDYLVIEQSFCSCKDFLFNVLLRRNVPSCYHLLAREIAEKTGKFIVMTTSDENYSEFMDNWLS